MNNRARQTVCEDDSLQRRLLVLSIWCFPRLRDVAALGQTDTIQEGKYVTRSSDRKKTPSGQKQIGSKKSGLGTLTSVNSLMTLMTRKRKLSQRRQNWRWIWYMLTDRTYLRILCVFCSNRRTESPIETNGELEDDLRSDLS